MFARQLLPILFNKIGNHRWRIRKSLGSGKRQLSSQFLWKARQATHEEKVKEEEEDVNVTVFPKRDYATGDSALISPRLSCRKNHWFLLDGLSQIFLTATLERLHSAKKDLWGRRWLGCGTVEEADHWWWALEDWHWRCKMVWRCWDVSDVSANAETQTFLTFQS